MPLQGPQTPLVLAGAMMQLVPGQQSALVLHPPQVGTHWFAEHTKGAPDPGFGTQGAPLQQSALDAHDAPAFTHCPSLHRGTPRLSCLHVSIVSQLPLQQSHEALQEVVASLHTAPFGLHPVGFLQTPTVLGATIEQVDGPPCGMLGLPTEPQQSVSLVQRSPTTWQPLAGWHTSTPVGPKGAHSRLQQAPPQLGNPPSVATVPLQSVPSTAVQFAPPPDGWLHVPRDAPAATVQMPPQQSSPVAQTSPFWPQNEVTAQTPPWHRPEQQSDAFAQVLPSVVHPVGASGVHVPPVQVPLQHSPPPAHALPLDVHAGKLHTPPVQSPLQQSTAARHAPPRFRQVAPSRPKMLESLPPDGPASVVASAPPSSESRIVWLPPHPGASRQAAMQAASATAKAMGARIMACLTGQQAPIRAVGIQLVTRIATRSCSFTPCRASWSPA